MVCDTYNITDPTSVYCGWMRRSCFCLSVAAPSIVSEDPSLRFSLYFAGTLSNKGMDEAEAQWQRGECHACSIYRLVGLQVRCPPRVRQTFVRFPLLPWMVFGFFSPRTIHISDLKIGTPAVALQGAWLYRDSTRTGWPVVSIL